MIPLDVAPLPSVRSRNRLYLVRLHDHIDIRPSGNDLLASQLASSTTNRWATTGTLRLRSDTTPHDPKGSPTASISRTREGRHTDLSELNEIEISPTIIQYWSLKV